MSGPFMEVNFEVAAEVARLLRTAATAYNAKKSAISTKIINRDVSIILLGAF